jgi:hypothetical protein
MPTEPIAGLPYPASSATDAPHTDIQALAVAVAKYLANQYASSSARDSAITSPQGGMLAWLTTPGRYSYHNGTSWADLGAMVGMKLIARDTGTGVTNGAAGNYANVATRTITNPFGSGVSFMILAIGQILFDATGAFNVSSGVSTDGTIPGKASSGIGMSAGGRGNVQILDSIVASGGGSLTLSTYVSVSSGTPTWYGDGHNNYVNWLAVPLAS